MDTFNIITFNLEKPVKITSDKSPPICRLDENERCSIVSRNIELYKPDSSYQAIPSHFETGN